MVVSGLHRPFAGGAGPVSWRQPRGLLRHIVTDAWSLDIFWNELSMI